MRNTHLKVRLHHNQNRTVWEKDGHYYIKEKEHLTEVTIDDGIVWFKEEGAAEPHD